MPRILFFSDTHNHYEPQWILSVAPLYDKVIFLGDGLRDAVALRSQLEDKLLILSGNCDWSTSYPNEEIVEIADKRLFVTHGNRYSTKTGIECISRRARELAVDAAVYGHTHRGAIKWQDDVLLFNVGSLSYSTASPEYGVIEFVEGKMYPQIIKITNYLQKNT